MKKILTLLVVVFLTNTSINAQFLEKLKNKAKEKIEKALTKKNKEQEVVSTKPKPSSKHPGKNHSITNNPVNIWRNYKFVPGEKIIFYDDLQLEEVGEFPSKWNLNEGGAEVASYNNEKLIIGTTSNDNTIFPLFDSKNYLTDEFTIDFDIFVDELSKENNNSWGYYNFIFTNKHLNSNSRSIAEVEFNQRSGVTGGYVLKYNFQLEEVPLGTLNAWHHIAISYNKGNFKLYYDENRIANIPKLQITPELFAIQMEGHSDNTYLNRKLNFGIRNVRIALGGGKIYNRITSSGTYTTNGILFDSGKSTVKSESMGIINKFIALLNENPDWKFQIVGHTDSDGDDNKNLTLSKQRAEAIKKIFVVNGINSNRLTTLGMGEKQPITPNKTTEDKANNRRVAFVKL